MKIQRINSLRSSGCGKRFKVAVESQSPHRPEHPHRRIDLLDCRIRQFVQMRQFFRRHGTFPRIRSGGDPPEMRLIEKFQTVEFSPAGGHSIDDLPKKRRFIFRSKFACRTRLKSLNIRHSHNVSIGGIRQLLLKDRMTHGLKISRRKEPVDTVHNREITVENLQFLLPARIIVAAEGIGGKSTSFQIAQNGVTKLSCVPQHYAKYASPFRIRQRITQYLIMPGGKWQQSLPYNPAESIDNTKLQVTGNRFFPILQQSQQ